MQRVLVVFALAGCVPTSYSYSPTTRGEAARTPGPNGCEFTVFKSPPEEDFEEIGVFKYYNGDVPKQDAELKKALAPRVCEVGGHAVIVSGDYQTATVIKYPKGFHL